MGLKPLRNIVITAVFQGKDKSLGYKTGRPYVLIVDKMMDGSIMIQHHNFEGSECVYQSDSSFLKNWMLRMVMVEKTNKVKINWEKFISTEIRRI